MRFDLWSCLALALVVSGCGTAENDATREMAGKLVPVTGTVMLDGKPLAAVAVNFRIDPLAGQGENATGVTDEAGKYALSTYVPGSKQGMSPGAIPGEYRVFITKLVMPDGSAVPPDVSDADAEAMNAKQFLPPKYSHFDLSQLKGTVNAEAPVIDFTLKSK